jgi:nucleoside phosphorylase
MRRIALGVAIVMLLGGVPASALAATAPQPSGVCAQPRLLILSAFPAEMGQLMKATKLDSVEPIRSAAPGSKEFWTGTLQGKPVIEGLTGIGPVNATDTTNAAFSVFSCISSVVFSGVAGAGRDHKGVNGAARQSRIGDVTVPDRWTTDGGKTWSTADKSMQSLAAKVAPSVSLQNTTPLEDYACSCVDWPTIPGDTFPYTPAVLFHGDGSTTDPFGGHAAPCLQHGGDLAGCEPCPAALGTSPDPERFITGMQGIADPGFITGLFALAGGSGSHEFIESDEETGAVAAVVNAHNVPFIGFRGISDGTADPLMLPGFPAQFFVYTQIAANNSAKLALAFVNAYKLPKKA